jgi:flagellar biosynthesis protein FlhA
MILVTRLSNPPTQRRSSRWSASAFGLVPGLPRFPLLVLAITMGAAGYLVRERERVVQDEVVATAQAETDECAQRVDSVVSILQVDSLEVEVG